MKNNRFISLALLFSFIFSLFMPLPTRAQETEPPAQILTLLQRMTPQERVAQLFLVSFTGTEMAEEGELAEFLAKYPVGGVILRADNGNFSAEPDGVQKLAALNLLLQQKIWNSATQEAGGYTTYMPLLIGVSQEDSRKLTGVSPSPSLLAIGATWDPALAQQNGEVLGAELTALGFNLFLGPSLDVLEDPNLDKSGTLGTSTFGGNSAWVGKMGKAYITGLHTGAAEKLLVVAQHFPGQGGADRAPDEEIPTAHKSIAELTEVDLPPFADVSRTPDILESADGLLIAHIRYQGFQGNIRPTTRPISFDEKTLAQIFAIPPFDTWRRAGGITLSDDLGSRAIRDFYAPGGGDFFAHIVARDAFLAGNDLLYMGNIVSTDAPDTFGSLAKAIDFFAQKYNEDSAFAERVNQALVRILTQKFRLYPAFSLRATKPPEDGLLEIGQTTQPAFQVAQNAASLISPDINDLDAVLPAPPSLGEQILFLTDTHIGLPCATCEREFLLSASALPEAVSQLYGEGGGGIISSEYLFAHAYDNFLDTLSAETDTLFQSNLRQANWVVILLSHAQNLPVLRQFLAENQMLLREKKVILFSFTAPYVLDSTDISKITAYYALYSYAPPFIDIAARLLFQEWTPVGAAPVTIPGVGYELDIVTQPSPDQLLTLALATPLETSPTPQPDDATPAPTPIPMFQVGDTLSVRTGAIVDHNGNIVPDGTTVLFSLIISGEKASPQLIETHTSGGIARADFQLERTGLMDIRVKSGEAIISETLRLDISDEGVAAAVTIIPPATEEAPSPTPTPTMTPTPEISPYFNEGKPRPNTWVIAFLLWGISAVLTYIAGNANESKESGVRWALATLLGGITAYNYLALGFPPTDAILESGISGLLTFIIFGEFLGWMLAWLSSRR